VQPAQGFVIVSVSTWPEQIEELPDIEGAEGSGFMEVVTVAEDPTHPLVSVTVTEKLPAVLTVIFWVFEALLHVYPTAGVDVSVTLLPWQKDKGPLALISGRGSGFTVVITTESLEQPKEFVYWYVTECVPAPAFAGEKLLVVIPLPENVPPAGVPTSDTGLLLIQ
jgi:hypothetical protein